MRDGIILLVIAAAVIGIPIAIWALADPEPAMATRDCLRSHLVLSHFVMIGKVNTPIYRRVCDEWSEWRHNQEHDAWLERQLLKERG